MKTFILANQKGGVGKSTTAVNIATILKNKGKKVLFIDADPQGNSTDSFKAKIKDVPTLYDVILDDERIPIAEAIQKLKLGDIVASDPLLTKADSILLNDVEGIYRFQDALTNLSGYDFVIIDTAPSMNSLLHSCLIAADRVIIPVTADRYAIQGLYQLNDTINAVKRRQNNKLKISGLLLTKYSERRLLDKEVKETLEKTAHEMNTKLFSTTIRESVKVKEAQALRCSLINYAPEATTAQDYKNFVDELLKGKV